MLGIALKVKDTNLELLYLCLKFLLIDELYYIKKLIDYIGICNRVGLVLFSSAPALVPDL